MPMHAPSIDKALPHWSRLISRAGKARSKFLNFALCPKQTAAASREFDAVIEAIDTYRALVILTVHGDRDQSHDRLGEAEILLTNVEAGVERIRALVGDQPFVATPADQTRLQRAYFERLSSVMSKSKGPPQTASASNQGEQA